MAIENAILEVNEIIKSKVVAINGNCIQGFKLDIIKLKEEYKYAIFLAITAIGDAVVLSVQQDQ